MQIWLSYIKRPLVVNVVAALLEELDDDEGQGQENGGSSNPGSAVKSAPASGGISSFFGRGGNGQSLQSRIDAELCALNGISAAETAWEAVSEWYVRRVSTTSLVSS